jgi:plasmid stabilization system protein ParE
MVRGIRERCRALKQFPGSGEDCPQAAPGMRRSLHRGYGIYYRIESNSEIWIVRVLHPSIEFERQDFS